MPKVFTSEKQKIGEFGENVAVKYLEKQGYEIVERNYTKKWGEIDIVARKDDRVHFVEVKSVTVDDLDMVYIEADEDRGADSMDEYRPEDNMHPWKLQRLSRTIQTYLAAKFDQEDEDGEDAELEWQVDLLVVYLDLESGKGKVKVVSDIIL